MTPSPSQDTYPREMIDKMNENFLLRIESMQDTIVLRIDAVHGIATETRDLAKKTNGRVDRLENERSYIRGALAIIALIVIPLLTYMFKTQLSDLKSEIAKGGTSVLPAASAAARR